MTKQELQLQFDIFKNWKFYFPYQNISNFIEKVNNVINLKQLRQKSEKSNLFTKKFKARRSEQK